jgi:hypothetical protein
MKNDVPTTFFFITEINNALIYHVQDVFCILFHDDEVSHDILSAIEAYT